MTKNKAGKKVAKQAARKKTKSPASRRKVGTRAKRLPHDSVYRKTILPNGLTVVSESHGQFQSLSMGIWVKVGTRHERAREAGISHFLEHMLFKGTEKRTALDIAREVDQVGGEFNAFTSREYTCFHLLLLKRDMALGMDLLNDILLHSTFDAQEFEREKKVILQEISMVEESPEEMVHDLYFELVYGKHGLGCPILGTERSVKRSKRGDLTRYFHKHYRPDQLVVAVAGDVSHQAVCKELKELSKKQWHGRTLESHEPAALAFEPAPQLKDGCWWIKRSTEQVHLIWGVEAQKYNSKDRYAASLLNVYLGGGMSSELFQEIREKNALAYTVYSSLSPFVDSGVFTIYAATAMHQVPLCIKLIEECVEKLKRDLLSDEDLRSVKENLKGTILLSSDSVESRMSSIALNEIFMDDYTTAEELCEEIDQVSAAEIRAVARRIFSTGKRSILALGPQPTKAVKEKLKPNFPKKYQ
ncbi:MAG: insulinase family protein [Methylotenera sp.]|nr:insulinase family protein [Oligoflexia bacterium]